MHVRECSKNEEEDRKKCNNCETTLLRHKYNLYLMTTVYVPVNIVVLDDTIYCAKMLSSDDMLSKTTKHDNFHMR